MIMKIRFLIISLLLLPFVAQAQYKGAMLEINSKTGVYQVGDSIKVWVVILPECNPNLEFSIQENMATVISQKCLNLNEGKHLVYEGLCKAPAHYVYTVGLPGTEKTCEKSSVGAIVSPESFTPGYASPKDLRKFWDRQIKKMRKMPLKAKCTLAPQETTDQSGYTCMDLEIPMPEGNPVRAYLVYPTDAPAKSLPILIRAHAAGVKGKWCQSSADQAIKDAKRGGGAIVLDINAHGMLNGQPQSYYDNLDSGQLKGYSSRV